MAHMSRKLLLLLVACGLAGCHAARLPPPVSRADTQLVAATRLPYRVAVERYTARAYSDRLIDDLRKTGLFNEVAYADSLSGPADLIASVQRARPGCAMIPILTILSLGLYPTRCEEGYGQVFALRSADRAEQVEVSFEGSGQVVLGWAGGALSLLPGWSARSVRDTKRFNEHVSLAIVRQAESIHRLARPRP
jgi:hypothetical protein